MLVERPLDGTPADGESDANDSHFETYDYDDVSVAQNFLESRPTAKIIFIVDTHSLDNGYFVYTGDSPTSHEACTLLEVGPPSHHAHVILPTLSTDPKRLLPRGDIQIPLQRGRHAQPQAQEHHRQPFMRQINLPGGATEQDARGVSPKPPSAICRSTHTQATGTARM
jgi:hypothetical protein